MLLVAATSAWAATGGFATGLYKGTSAQGLKLSFKATKHQVKRFVVKEKGTCSNGSATSGKQGPFTMMVDANGNFSESGTSPSGATRSKVVGKLSGNQASGTFRVDVRFDTAGKPNRNGVVKCTTGKVHWTAKLG